MKALLLRLSAIGDVVHALPMLSALHRHQWQVGWLAEPPGRALLAGHPYLWRLAAAPAARRFDAREARGALRGLRSARYDVALDVQGLWKSAAWGRLSGARRLVGYGAAGRVEPLSSALLHERLRLDPGAVHVIDENLALLRAVGIEAVGTREFVLPDTALEARQVEAALAAAGIAPGTFVVLNAGGGWPEKLWPPEAYAEVARGLRERGLAALVTWGPGEQALADRVVAASEGAARRCFPTDLRQFLELARRARVVVAADTGPLHIACAVGAPVVGIYGPTDPARNGPFSADDVVVRRRGPADPRHRGRFLVAPREMAAITAGEVLDAVGRRLARAAAQASRAL
ncbi:MAG TPA: glycosyltransferase family 9 protein [Vicinamibacteria bacterium]|nr:glycosyltransferase family 9 protein [Vicinamibacteria bacterium]